MALARTTWAPASVSNVATLRAWTGGIRFAPASTTRANRGMIAWNRTPRRPLTCERPMPEHRIFTTSFASVYPLYVAKAERKGRTRAEVDEIILWLTGFSSEAFAAQLADQSDFRTFFAQAPAMNPARAQIKGVICGVRVEDIEDPLMREIRYLDKLIDELARGKAMGKILRG